MFWANSMAWFTGLILAGLFDRACHWFMVLECLLHDLRIKKKYKGRFSSHCFHYIWKKLWAIPWRWLKHLFCNFLSVQFCLLLFLSLFCRFFVISVLACNFVCHVPNNFWYFPYFWDNCTKQMTKKKTNKSTKWQEWQKGDDFAGCKNDIFLEALYFFVIFLSLFEYFQYDWKMCQNNKKWQKSTTWQKYSKHDNFAGCKNYIFLEALSFLAIFLSFRRDFLKKYAKISNIVRKIQAWQNKDNFACCKNCIFLEVLPFFWSFFCHVGAIFSKKCKNIKKIFQKWQQNDKQWQCFKKNDIFATCKIVIFSSFLVIWWMFLSFFWSFWHIFQTYWKIYQNYSNNDRKMTMLWEKCTICATCKIVIVFFCDCLIIFVQFCQKYGQRSKSIRKLTRKDNASRKRQFLQPAKWQNMTNKMTDQNSNDKKMAKHDKQNWNYKKWQKWQTKLKWQKITTKIKNDKLNSLFLQPLPL